MHYRVWGNQLFYFVLLSTMPITYQSPGKIQHFSTPESTIKENQREMKN